MKATQIPGRKAREQANSDSRQQSVEMADSTANATFPVGDVPKDAAWYDMTRRVFFDEYHVELSPQECLRRQAIRRNRNKRERNCEWKEAQQVAFGCASAARAHPRGAADELLSAEAPQKRVCQRGWCKLLG